jgi:class 3 adenylate cyclase
MAYFGDPVPRPDAAVVAVRVAAEIGARLDALVAEWTRRGHALHYGIGVAHGYATLGVVGFDGRYDYTALGPVVNLGARLCAQAAPGQILLDHAAHAATADDMPSEFLGELDLKGYAGSTRAYLLTARGADVPGRPRPRPQIRR